MKEIKHGYCGYTKHGCRCNICCDARRLYQYNYRHTTTGRKKHLAGNKRYNKTHLGKLTQTRGVVTYYSTVAGKLKCVARRIVANAIKNKLIIVRPCSECGSTDYIHAHHKDYSKPLDIIWLCRKHHFEIHNNSWREK